MNIEVSILMDGQPVKVNSDLQNLLSNMVSTYIKQKFIIGKNEPTIPTIKKERKPIEWRPQVTPAEIEVMFARAPQLTHMQVTPAIELIAKELGRSSASVYKHIMPEVNKGRFVFKKKTDNLL